MFVSALTDVLRLLETELSKTDVEFVHRLLFANVITVMETYLSDAFSVTVLANPALVRKYVESSPSFQQEKFPVANVYSLVETIEKRVRSDLSRVMWHDIKKVSGMYRNALGVEFPSNLDPIYRAIIIRHHIVHRNGKDDEGNPVIVSKDDVVDLLTAVSALVNDIDTKLPGRGEPRDTLALDFENDEGLPF